MAKWKNRDNPCFSCASRHFLYPLRDMPRLILQDGSAFEGEAFGAGKDTDGEVVFNTGMAGYTESLTDPSYRGQILVFTYPLIGNYGVPSAEKNEYGFSRNYESEAVQVRGVVVAQASADFSHHAAVSSLHNWLQHHGVPGITGVDTRALTKKLREHGVMLGRIEKQGQALFSGLMAEKKTGPVPVFENPNLSNLVAEVSVKEVKTYEPAEPCGLTVAAFDCGMKNGILRSFLARGVRVHRLPWDYNLAASDLAYDAVFISNGPGDPKMCGATIAQIAASIGKGIPTFGICLGNQLMALAVGGDTYKLPYGHRGANQPCVEHTHSSAGLSQTLSIVEGRPADICGETSKGNGQKCIITSQNHGFAVSAESLPPDWNVWFTNANDGTVEGIRHTSGPFAAVQFHPEATPGPEDADYLFDEFISAVKAV